jgi:tetratricopeptide (TPR) repeat protein
MTLGNPLAGLWEFRWLQEIVVCSNCKTKNRLRHGRPRPGCGKCKRALDDARAVPPARITAPRFLPITDGGRKFLQLVRDAHMSFESRMLQEAVQDYDAAIALGMSGQVLEAEDLSRLMAELYYHKGVSLFGLQRFQEAAESFKVAIPGQRFEAQLYVAYLACLEKSGRLARSVLVLRHILGHDVPPSVRKVLAPGYVPTDDPDSSLAVSGFWYALSQVDPTLDALNHDLI